MDVLIDAGEALDDGAVTEVSSARRRDPRIVSDHTVARSTGEGRDASRNLQIP
jgi:hypothetical protein